MHVKRSAKIRAVCFTAVGQRVEGWLPAGDYLVCRDGELIDGGRDGGKAVAIRMIDVTGTSWFVAPQVIGRTES